MKTAETLLLAGDAGSYLLKHADIDPHYRQVFVRLWRCLGRCMHKVSTPGDRQAVSTELAEICATLEMTMPISWETIVMHILCFHTVQIMQHLGPFHASNMLDAERYGYCCVLLAVALLQLFVSII